MAGHSKWANIQHRKGRQDAKRGKIFTKLVKEITVAARLSGGDINFNPRLRSAVTTAKEQSMPAENITRAIKKGTGELEGVNYEEIRYEGYGISGVAIIIDCLTDNKVRAVADVRHALSKNGGNLGTDGSVSFLFKHCGSIFFAPLDDSEALMDEAINLGADDVIINDDKSIEIITAPNDFY
jgi:YebC/PmpR family DNA-binding regulatory protein